MKQIIFSLIAFVTISANAQKFSLTDNFDTNANGWTEIVDKKGESQIIESVLRLKSKKVDGFYESHCFTDLDVRSNFEIKCEVKVKSINDESTFGLMLNYVDDGNFIVFMVQEGNAKLIKFEDGRQVGAISNTIKLKAKRNSNVEFSVKNTTGKLTFDVNGMKAIEARYVDLTSSGIGFYIYGEQTVSFDNLQIIQ